MPNTPTSPPAGPVIPVGFGTKLGLIVATILGAATAIQAFLDGDHSDTTIATLVGAVLMIYKILDGRYNQATAAVAAEPDMVDDTDVPDEDELAATYEGERQPEPMSAHEGEAMSVGEAEEHVAGSAMMPKPPQPDEGDADAVRKTGRKPRAKK